MGPVRLGRWSAIPLVVVLLLAGAVLCPARAGAEAMPARLTVERVRGASLFGKVAGVFRLAVQTSGQARMVTFYLDGRVIGYATRHPFSVELDTGEFPTGAHDVEAVVHMDDGSVVTSNRISLEFRPRNWRLAARHWAFLYLVVVMVVAAVAALSVRSLLQLQPRLVLLERRLRRPTRRR